MSAVDHEASNIIPIPPHGGALSLEAANERIHRAEARLQSAVMLRGIAPQSEERDIHTALAILRGER